MKFFTSAAVATLLLLTGCGGGSGLKTHPVSGKITVNGGGKVANGIVQMSSGEFTSVGGIMEDGSYTMSSVGEGDGVPPGTYSVVFLSTFSGGDILDDGSMTPKFPTIHSKYEVATTSGIKVTVPGDSYDFVLDPPEAE